MCLHILIELFVITVFNPKLSNVFNVHKGSNVQSLVCFFCTQKVNFQSQFVYNFMCPRLQISMLFDVTLDPHYHIYIYTKINKKWVDSNVADLKVWLSHPYYQKHKISQFWYQTFKKFNIRFFIEHLFMIGILSGCQHKANLTLMF